MGWLPDEFWESSYFDTVLAIVGNQEAQEVALKMQWEHTRFLATVFSAPNLKKGQKADPRVLFPLPWDEDLELAIPKPSEEGMRAIDMLDLARSNEIRQIDERLN